MDDYRAVLDWIAADADGETSTVAVTLSSERRAVYLWTAVARTGLPLINGHGGELTPVHNRILTNPASGLPCPSLQIAAREFGVGYFVGTDPAHRQHLRECLGATTSFERGKWWGLATGQRWANSPRSATGFAHDETWTELRWTFEPAAARPRVVLPVANTAPWEAEVDGRSVAIGSTPEHMMRVALPEGGRELRLRYKGYAGEWTSTAVALSGLILALWRQRGRRSTDDSPPA